MSFLSEWHVAPTYKTGCACAVCAVLRCTCRRSIATDMQVLGHDGPLAGLGLLAAAAGSALIQIGTATTAPG